MPKTPELSKWTYESMFDRLVAKGHKWEAPVVTLYNNTTFEWEVADDDDAGNIVVRHFDTAIASVDMNGNVTILHVGQGKGTWHSRYRNSTDGQFTETTKRRIGYLLLANCNKNLAAIRRTLKVYDVASGGYTDFRLGMTVSK